MNHRDFFMERWQADLPATLRVLRALPAAKLDYRPHPVSRSAGELGTLLVSEVESAIEMIEKGDINWSEPKGGGTPEEMAAAYERLSRKMLAGLRNVDDATWGKKIRLFFNGQQVHEQTFGGMCWELLLDSIHHRGQLSVYLRPMGGKVPSIYGPSADDAG